ncbi:MAG: AarF/ABC1/UbiB kinase family protein [Gaiellales bacterium]|nr:AarF/ABC1/UbiB kinase family protein [Gaiellales bacterium]
MSRFGRILTVVVGHSLAAAKGTRFGLVSREERRRMLAVEVRRALEDLGPAFIKIGQLMSVRPDVFPPELAVELGALRDSVAPVDPTLVRGVIQHDLGFPAEVLFSSFDPVPIASASIAQVHRARLREAYRPVCGATLPAGTALAVKVVRPGIEEEGAADLEAAARLARGLHHRGLLRRWNLPAYALELRDSFRRESDLRNEARVAVRFAFDFRDDPLVRVPRVVWPLSSRRVLTTEYVEGWPLSRVEEARRAGVDARGLAAHGARVFMRQVLEHGRFHADLHPANLLLTPDGRIAYLDFGMVGRLSAAERVGVAQVLAALVFRDAERALRYSSLLGLEVPPDVRARLVGEVGGLMQRTLREGRGDGRVGRTDVKGFGVGLLGILGRHHVPIPEGYGLLVKSLVTVEGVARALYPEIDIIETARPFVTRLLARRVLDPSTLASRWATALRAAAVEVSG